MHKQRKLDILVLVLAELDHISMAAIGTDNTSPQIKDRIRFLAGCHACFVSLYVEFSCAGMAGMSQLLTEMDFNAISGLVMIGVRWPQPVTWQGPCLAQKV